MTGNWWCLPSSTWIPLYSMGTEHRTILSGLLPHSINLLIPPKSIGGDPQNEQAKFCMKPTLLSLIKKSSCCLCLPFAIRLQPSQWLTGNFDKYYTNLKKTNTKTNPKLMLKHMSLQTFTHHCFFYSIFCTQHFKNINPCKLPMKKH